MEFYLRNKEITCSSQKLPAGLRKHINFTKMTKT